MRTKSGVLVAALLFFGVAAHAQSEPFGQLKVTEVQARLKDKNVFVFDNNNPDRYKKGHIPGAKFAKYDELAAAELPADKTATLIFYCANEKCMACHKAARLAMELGYKNVFVMPAGIIGWEKAGLPIERGAL